MRPYVVVNVEAYAEHKYAIHGYELIQNLDLLKCGGCRLDFSNQDDLSTKIWAPEMQGTRIWAQAWDPKRCTA